MELPGTVTRLSDQAFTGCTALTGVTIPSKVELSSSHLVNGRAFAGCVNLTQFQVNPKNRKLYAQDLKPECFVEPDCDSRWYPDKDYHTMYVVEVEKILKAE